MTRIKGTAIRGALKFVKNADGSVSIPDVIAALPDDVRPVFDQRILASEWYPYPAYAELLREIDGALGQGDLRLMPELGRFLAEQDVQGVLRIIASFSSVESLVSKGEWFWSRYCDTGRSIVLESDAGKAIMALQDFPNVAIHHCHAITGWLGGLAERVGGKSVRSVQTRCVHRGDTRCQWEATWS